MKKYLGLIFIFLLVFCHVCTAIASSEIIEDEAAKELSKNQTLSKNEFKPETIEDEIADKTYKGKHFLQVTTKKEIIIEKIDIPDTGIQKVKTVTKPITEDDVINVYVCSATTIGSSSGKKVGDKVYFKVSQDVYKNGKLFIKKDTDSEAVLENISKQAMGGDPEEIEIGSFSTRDAGGNLINLTGSVRKQGANRATWVKPIVYTGYASIPFGAPLMVVVLVKGGKARITPKENYKLYYEQ